MVRGNGAARPFQCVGEFSLAPLDDLRAAWESVAPDVPFNYVFLDDAVAQQYETETRTANILTGFAGLAIFLACLGLFGMAAYSARRRTKEIGIRKVLGASVAQIVVLVSREFAALVAVAALVAAPLAWWAVSHWLEGFAYRAPIRSVLFAEVASIVLVVALAAVGAQAWRAATADPVRALRSE